MICCLESSKVSYSGRNKDFLRLRPPQTCQFPSTIPRRNVIETMKHSRRTFLHGIGATIGLPVFETFAAAAPVSVPRRMAVLYVPNGVDVARWKVNGTGADYEISESLKPIEKFRKDFTIIEGLEHENGTAGPDGGGDHARANASYLTGVRPRKTAGADIQLGTSMDQIAANALGDLTRFSSLELSTEGVRKSGVCDSGYSCAYQFNLSWRSSTQPVAPESNPRLVFERLFGTGKGEERTKNRERRIALRKSILDFVNDEAKSLHQQLGRNDKQKLDEYLTGVREIEQRIEKAEKFGLPDPKRDAPGGIPSKFEDHLRLIMDMQVLAFQTDSTRVSTFILAHEGSNRSFRDIGVPEGHHTLSHHRDDPEKLDKIAKIDQFYTRQFAYYLEKMSAVKEADGKSLLDHSMVLWGGGLSDGNRHRHNDLPIILAGRGGGGFKTGRHLNLGKDTPMTNLHLSMLEQLGVKEEVFGDSNGRVDLG